MQRGTAANPSRLAHGVGLGRWYGVLTVVSFVLAMVLLVVYTPVEPTMGPIQKLYYLHLPVAIETSVAALVVFLASLGYLWHRTAWLDDLARGAGELTLLYGTVVLLTGMAWARVAWGHWWVWNAPLTFSLVLWGLYAGYVGLRPMLHARSNRATLMAVYGVAAFLDVPLVYASARLIPDRHPVTIVLTSPMRVTLLVWFVPITLLAVGVLSARCRRGQRARSATELAIKDGPREILNGVVL